MTLTNHIKLVKYLTSNNIKEYLIKKLNKKNYLNILLFNIKIIKQQLNYIKSNSTNLITYSRPPSPTLLFIRKRKNFLCILKNQNFKTVGKSSYVVKFFSTKQYRPFRDKTWKIFNLNKKQNKKNIQSYKELQKKSKYRRNTPVLQKRILWQLYFSLKSLRWLHLSFNLHFRNIRFSEVQNVINTFSQMVYSGDKLTGISKFNKNVPIFTYKNIRILYQYPFNGCKSRKKRRI
jgi:hypothetical protein